MQNDPFPFFPSQGEAGDVGAAGPQGEKVRRARVQPSSAFSCKMIPVHGKHRSEAL